MTRQPERYSDFSKGVWTEKTWLRKLQFVWYVVRLQVAGFPDSGPFLCCLGVLQRNKFQKSEFRLWEGVGGSRSHSGFFFGKSSQNSSKPVLWSIIQCVFCLYRVYIVLSVLSMSVSDGFPKTSLDGGVGGSGELHPSFLFWIFGLLCTLQSPLADRSLFPR